MCYNNLARATKPCALKANPLVPGVSLKRAIWILLAVVTFLSGIRGTAVAQAPGPTMQVAIGFDGYCRSDAWCPMRVVLTNEGADITGELRVAIPGGGDTYLRAVTLPGHSRKAYFLYFPGAGPFLRSRMEVRLVADEEVLTSQEVAIVWADAREPVYGVAGSDPSALNFLSNITSAGKRARVAHLDLEALPPDPLGWEALDVLVLNDVDTSALGNEQRRALETWVMHGGHLIVGGGAGAARTAAGVADLLPVVVTGLRQVDDLGVLGQMVGAAVTAGPFAVAETGLRDGQALIEQGDLVLRACRSYGAGQVDFLAFDAGLNPFARWDDNIRLWRQITEARSTSAQLRTVKNEYSLREAVNAIPGLKSLSTLEIVAFMLTYTALIGPVNYLVLRRLKRRELAWLTIPLITLGFTVFAYVTGYSVRGRAAIVHCLGMVYVPRGASVGRVSEAVGLFSPRRTRYDVWVAGAQVRALFDPYGRPNAPQKLHVAEEMDGSTVTGLRVDVGGIQSFLVEGYADVSPVEADLHLKNDAAGRLILTGTLRNGRLLLRDALIIVGDGEQRLGDIAPEQTVQAGLVFGTVSGPGVNLPDRIVGSRDYWRDREAYRRYQFLQVYFSDYYDSALASLRQGVYLVGWTEESVPLPVEVMGRPFSTPSLALYVYELPVVAEVGENATLPPAFLSSQVESSRGNVTIASADTFYLGPQSEIVFRFTIWPEVAVGHVDELVVDLQKVSYIAVNDLPIVSLWNYESGRWEKIDIGWGRHTVPNATAYVSPSDEILLRLETGKESETMGRLAITIRGQR